MKCILFFYAAVILAVAHALDDSMFSNRRQLARSSTPSKATPSRPASRPAPRPAPRPAYVAPKTTSYTKKTTTTKKTTYSKNSNRYMDLSTRRTSMPLYSYYHPVGIYFAIPFYSPVYRIAYYDGYGYNFYYGAYGYYEYAVHPVAYSSGSNVGYIVAVILLLVLICCICVGCTRSRNGNREEVLFESEISSNRE
jgi:hypothetical protein